MKKTLIALVVVIAVLIVALFVRSREAYSPAPSPVATTTADTAASPTASSSATIAPSKKVTITWKFDNAGEQKTTGIPYTRITVSVDGVAHDAGTYQGVCHEVTERNYYFGSGPDANEISTVTCGVPGGGEEIGVFSENGKLVVKAGELDEPAPPNDAFRGNFKTVLTL